MRVFLCNHRNGDLFTCEDIMFSRESSSGIMKVLAIHMRANWSESVEGIVHFCGIYILMAIRQIFYSKQSFLYLMQVQKNLNQHTYRSHFLIATLKLLYFPCLQIFLFKQYCLSTRKTFCAAKTSERVVSIQPPDPGSVPIQRLILRGWPKLSKNVDQAFDSSGYCWKPKLQ